MPDNHSSFSEQQLAAALFRAMCPGPDALREYLFGFLPQAEEAELRTHLARCPHCAREYAELAQFVELPPRQFQTDGPLARLGVAVAELLDSLSGLTSATAGLRGRLDEPFVLQMRLPGPSSEAASDTGTSFEVSLRVEPAPDGVSLIGSVSDGLLEGWSVDLWQAGVLQASTVVDDLDGFEFSDFPLADFRLLFRSDDHLILTPPLLLSA